MARRTPSPSSHPTERLLGESPAIQHLRQQIRQLASFDAVGNPHVPTLLLQGETGTGKRLIARIVHDSGPRAPGPCLEHISQALEVLKTLPDTHERRHLQLRLRLTLLPTLLTLHGFAAPEVAQTYAQAQRLWRALGQTAPLPPYSVRAVAGVLLGGTAGVTTLVEALEGQGRGLLWSHNRPCGRRSETV